MNRPAKASLVALGTLSVALGAIGMVVPLVPATPFLLLAGYCFSRSSPRFHRWLLTNRYCGAYIDNYRSGRGMVLRDKVVSLVTLWGTLGITGATAVDSWWGRLLLLAVGAGVTAHLARLRTCRPGRSRTGHSDLQPPAEATDRAD